jgi:type I restriction enzyme R subunit
MGKNTSEDAWELQAMDNLAELGWEPKTGQDIGPGSGERRNWGELYIRPRIEKAVRSLNVGVPEQYLQQALDDILTPKSTDAITENQRIHDYLTRGYRGISYIDDDGMETTPTIQLLAPEPHGNDWLAVRQVTLIRAEYKRRFDIVMYCNGFPLSIIELKKAAGAASSASAQAQLTTYRNEFPLAFAFVAFVLASDGISAIYGTPFTPDNHFSPWNVNDDGVVVSTASAGSTDNADTALDTALFGLYNLDRFLQLLRNFVAFDVDDTGLSKRIAKPHQFFAVTKAVEATIQAVETNGKAGVVWHTQGSGKSMEMELYTHLVMASPKLLNPTVVVITDRKELDGQLYEGFARSRLLAETPKAIRKRAELRAELTARNTGGILFTTLQKFGRSIDERESGADHPLLSDRRNIIVIVDEAHRSHYDNLDGYARHLRDALPRATLIAFTGTPISTIDRNTREVFGDYIDVYDLTRAVEDGATVPVYFEPRLIKVDLASGVTDEDLDRVADEATAGLDDTERSQIEQSVAVVNAVYGAPGRLAALATDLVPHWETRRAAMQKFIEVPGKAMIVCATRLIAANLYEQIIKLRPDWHSDELDRGVIKVVYSGDPTDTEPVSRHVRRESANKSIKNRLKDPDDELELVIVKDMMLTGYDSPPLHTLYLDRPLRGALLMQTLARVNRTFRGKKDGLLVGYAPIAENLSAALAEYSTTDQTSKPVGRSTEEAASTVQELVAVISGLMAGFDWKARLKSSNAKAFSNAAAAAANYLRDPATPGNDAEPGARLSDQFRRRTQELDRAWALAASSTELRTVRPFVEFFSVVRVYMAKFDAIDRQSRGEPIPDDIRRTLAALIDRSTETGEVLDIYAAAGMRSPDLSELTPGYGAETSRAENPQLAIEALRALVAAESRKATRNNAVRQRAFSERLNELMTKYTNQQLTSAEVIAELVAMAKEAAAERNRGKAFTPALSDDELAFYDAVAQNESAVQVQGEGILAQIARELVGVMRRDVRTDWTVREDVRAKLRTSIKRLLAIHDYPPDQQPEAIKLVMEQMEALAPRFAVERERSG